MIISFKNAVALGLNPRELQIIKAVISTRYDISNASWMAAAVSRGATDAIGEVEFSETEPQTRIDIVQRWADDHFPDLGVEIKPGKTR